MLFRKLLISSAILLCMAVNVYAGHVNKMELVPIAVPADFDISISDHCSGHEVFIQAAAANDGSFAVYAPYTDIKQAPELVYKRYYVDLYAPDGSLYKEISFNCPFDSSIELTDEMLFIYFYDKVMTFNLKTEVFSYFTLQEGEHFNTNDHAARRQADFSCGEWEYTCTKSLDGFVGMQRTNINSGKIESPISYDGTSVNVSNVILLPLIVAIAFSFLRFFGRKRR